MSSIAKMTEELRAKIIAEPDVILDDKDVMEALITANEKALGSNIVDLRGIAMERLAARLDRLEDTHRSVIAAAYENLAGTNQIHRAVLQILSPVTFEGFLATLRNEVAEILKVDAVRLLLETADQSGNHGLDGFGNVLMVVEEGFVRSYVTGGRDIATRQVTLRQMQSGPETLYGANGDWVRSEACMTLDLGTGRLPGLLVLASEDPHLFAPSQGTDLLTFFAGCTERAIRRWLA